MNIPVLVLTKAIKIIARYLANEEPWPIDDWIGVGGYDLNLWTDEKNNCATLYPTKLKSNYNTYDQLFTRIYEEAKPHESHRFFRLRRGNKTAHRPVGPGSDRNSAPGV